MVTEHLIKSKTFEINTLEELDVIVQFIKNEIKHSTYIIHLNGQLGAGKTTLASRLLKYLGVEQVVNSPTFTYVKTYQSNERTIYHYDLYRIKEELSSSEKLKTLEQLGYPESTSDKSGIIIIEWAEKCKNELVNPNMVIEIQDIGVRKFNIKY